MGDGGNRISTYTQICYFHQYTDHVLIKGKACPVGGGITHLAGFGAPTGICPTITVPPPAGHT